MKERVYVIARNRTVTGFVTAFSLQEALIIAHNRRWITPHERDKFPQHMTPLQIYRDLNLGDHRTYHELTEDA